MFCKLICTSFNNIKTTNNSNLGLMSEWVEECENTDQLDELCQLWRIDANSFKYPSVGSVSEIIDGVMRNDCPIHIRIVRF